MRSVRMIRYWVGNVKDGNTSINISTNIGIFLVPVLYRIASVPTMVHTYWCEMPHWCFYITMLSLIYSELICSVCDCTICTYMYLHSKLYNYIRTICRRCYAALTECNSLYLCVEVLPASFLWYSPYVRIRILTKSLSITSTHCKWKCIYTNHGLSHVVGIQYQPLTFRSQELLPFQWMCTNMALLQKAQVLCSIAIMSFDRFVPCSLGLWFVVVLICSLS
jgi:hypothetical protein